MNKSIHMISARILLFVGCPSVGYVVIVISQINIVVWGILATYIVTNAAKYAQKW